MLISVSEIKIPDVMMRKQMSEKGLEHLARSMKVIGLNHPIGVQAIDGGFELVHGARRLAAAKMLEWKEIEVSLVHGSDEIVEMMKVMENREREDVNSIDEGIYYKELLIKKGWTQAKLAEMLQVSPGFISQRVSASEWPKSLREAVGIGAIAFSTAREIAAIKDYEHLLYIVTYAARSGATPSVAREWRIRANIDYNAKLIREAAGENGVAAEPLAEPMITCHPCDRKVSVGDSSTFTVCIDCRELIEAIRDQGLFRENREKGKVEDENTE